MPGGNNQKRVLPIKRGFNMFGSPPTIHRRRTFPSSESIFKEAAIPSF